MVDFIVTGFGPFGTVKENPTTFLVRKLSEYLRDRENDATGSSTDRSTTRTMLIETSLTAAKEQVDALYDELVVEMEKEATTSSSGATFEKLYFLLHLGVHDAAQNFALEECAYNEANFSIPDQRGCQPLNEPVVEGELGAKFSTLLDVPALVQQMNGTCVDEQGRPRAAVSTDPGRFVCNYTYCYSLDKFKCSQGAGRHEQLPNMRCLFLHVPPFSVIPEVEQLDFVASLMDAIEAQLAIPKKVCVLE
jgi:pyroglutamyl-peptidase